VKAVAVLLLGIGSLVLAAAAFRAGRTRDRFLLAGGLLAVVICLFISLVAAVVIALLVLALAATSSTVRRT
jgi:hypothetical protein